MTQETTQLTKGYCLCRKTTFEYVGETNWECYCHCDDCCRNCAAPVVAWLGVPEQNFKWTGDTPKTYQSSERVTRYFCETCGTPIGFVAAHYPGGMHLYASTLEDPSKFDPTFHVNFASKQPWLPLVDDLEKHDKTLLHSRDDLIDYSD